MRLIAIAASPNPQGNRIDITWKFPDAPEYPGVRIMRREGTHPLHPNDGDLVAEGDNLHKVSDTGLKSETVYYYGFFPYRGDPREYAYDRRNRAMAMATGFYDYAKRIYELLPAVYHRYDTELPDPTKVVTEDIDKPQLRRFLDISGGQLNQLHSFARFLPKTRNIRHVPGNMLSLLAHWIGWKTNSMLEYEGQRNEVIYAPHLYQRIGIIPTIGATVKRISGWESRSKEFVHNVHRSNTPERLNLWLMECNTGDPWPSQGSLLSLDHAYDGRPELVRHDDTLWLFYHTPRNSRWDIWYKSYDIGISTAWSASQRLSNSGRVDKYPTAASLDTHLYLFWASCDDSDDQQWQVNGKVLIADEWSSTDTPSGSGAQRRLPTTAVTNDTLWLFWLEKSVAGWYLQYDTRTNSSSWTGNVVFPDDVGGENPRVEDDLHVVLQPPLSTPRLFVFWARKTDGPEAGQKRWEIAYRVKNNLNPDDTGWSNVRVLAKSPANADWHDRQPFGFINDADELELYWSSNRESEGWSIWHSRLTTFDTDMINGIDTWEAPQQVTNGVYSQNHPAVISSGSQQWLLYRSNKHLLHQSEVYRATTIVDERYNGALTVDMRHGEKIALRGSYNDFQTYSYDTNKSDDDWYARDTVGVFLDNDTMDETSITQHIDRLKPVIKEFMPLTDRAVFFNRSDLHTDYVYNYGDPLDTDSYTITESYSDELNGTLVELALSPGEDFGDAIE